MNVPRYKSTIFLYLCFILFALVLLKLALGIRPSEIRSLITSSICWRDSFAISCRWEVWEMAFTIGQCLRLLRDGIAKEYFMYDIMPKSE